MNMLNRKCFIFLLVIATGLTVCAQSQVKAQPQTNEPKKITRAVVETSMREMSDLIINGYADKGKSDSRVISVSQLKIYEEKYKTYYNLPEIEKMTGNSREWFGKLYKLVQAMNKCSFDINDAVIKLQVDKIDGLKKQYADLQKAYKEVYDNPQKPK